MARETKVGMLIGLAVILLVGIIVSDHMSVVSVSEGAPSPLSKLASGQDITSTSDVPGVPLLQPRPSAPLLAPDEIDERDAELGVRPALRSLVDPNAVSITSSSRMNASRRASDRGVTLLPSLATHGLSSASLVHVVKRGETLEDIARIYFGKPGYWRVIMEANPRVVTASGEVSAGAKLYIPSKRAVPLAPAVAYPGDLPELPLPMGSDMRVDAATLGVAASEPEQVVHITVQQGDSLSELAAEHLGTSARWRELLEANDHLLHGDPRSLKTGMRLTLPAFAAVAPPAAADLPTPTATRAPTQTHRDTPTERTYVVQAGDSLFAIASKTLGDGGKYLKIYEANRDVLSSEDDIREGQTLRIPQR